MKWHKVAEELPPEDVHVLLCRNIYVKDDDLLSDYHVGYIDSEFGCLYEDPFIWTLSQDRCDHFSPDTFSHWAEIEPPEEDK